MPPSLLALLHLRLKPDGSCCFLEPDNTCAIYEHRPDLCNIDKWKPEKLTPDEWYEFCKNWCQEIKKRLNTCEELPNLNESTPHNMHTVIT